MSGIREQTYDAVSGAVNDTFGGDAMMDVPDVPAQPFWRRHMVAIAIAALAVLVLGWLWWSKKKKKAVAAQPAAVAVSSKKNNKDAAKKPAAKGARVATPVAA